LRRENAFSSLVLALAHYIKWEQPEPIKGVNQPAVSSVTNARALTVKTSVHNVCLRYDWQKAWLATPAVLAAIVGYDTSRRDPRH
jgi:hypothetical protein